METMTWAEEIDTLIRARYPILYLVTPEESRVQGVLEEIARGQGKRIYEWSCTTGLLPSGTSIQSQHSRQTSSQEPLAAFEQVIDQVEPALFIFKDLHVFFGKADFRVIRKLKEIAQQLRNSRKTIIVVSPCLIIPIELEKEVTVLNFPLPNRQDLAALLDRIIEEVKPLNQVAIELDPPGRERLLQAALGLTMIEAENVFAKILIKSQRLTDADVPEVFSEKQQIVRKSGLLEYCAGEESFAQVGGLAVLKEWLGKRALAFSEEARAFGLPPPKGILLLGIQGCGKSLCAKAVASLWQLPLLRFDMGRMFGSLVGSSEQNVRQAISIAESVAPTVLWIEEIEKAFAGSLGSGISDGGTTARVFATLLTWLSEKRAPVFVVATANDISNLPPELLRKGRFDEIFFIDLPRAAEREEIVRIHLAKRARNPEDFDVMKLVEAAQGLSGAEIEEAIVSALYDAFAARCEVATEHILHSLRQAVPLSRTMQEQVSQLRQWAAGRARVASLSDGVETVSACA